MGRVQEEKHMVQVARDQEGTNTGFNMHAILDCYLTSGPALLQFRIRPDDDDNQRCGIRQETLEQCMRSFHSNGRLIDQQLTCLVSKILRKFDVKP
jgi:hypothetical protein